MFVVVCDVYDVYNVQVYVCVHTYTSIRKCTHTLSISLSLSLSGARARALSHTNKHPAKELLAKRRQERQSGGRDRPSGGVDERRASSSQTSTCIVHFHSKYTRALTFKNLCQEVETSWGVLRRQKPRTLLPIPPIHLGIGCRVLEPTSPLADAENDIQYGGSRACV